MPFVVFGVLVIGGLYLVANPPFRDREFDSEVWKASAGDEARYLMYDDLVDDHDLVGMPRRAVLELLGPDCDCGYFRDWDLVYNMGLEPGLFRIDSIWLVLRFDADGKVSEYDTVTD